MVDILNSKLTLLRVNIRKNFKHIIDNVIDQHLSKVKICIFCGTSHRLTREHVIPKWVIQDHNFSFFIDNTNGHNYFYERATVPCCQSCNNDILSLLEKKIKELLRTKELGKKLYTPDDEDLIVRWFEIIDYKFQILDLQKKFTRHKDREFVAYIKDVPLTMMKHSIKGSSCQAFKELRQSLRRISIKNKNSKENSLIFMTTTNNDSHFMHSDGHFIFIELPIINKALFYFLESEFKSHSQALRKAQKILNKAY
jgi:hypothetical protein